MCGRFTLRTNLAALAEQFDFVADQAVFEWYNIAPTQDVATVRLYDGQRQFKLTQWGLIPSWAKEAKIGCSTINARADTVATKPAFRAAYKARRCLVLADGYYEWLKVGKAKQPYLYEVDGGRPFAFAGLWEQWWGTDHQAPQPVETCTVITTDANELARAVHDRMPVILDPADYDDWLTGQQIPLLPFPADRMSVRPVSTFVNNSRNQGPGCVTAEENSA